jgi:hypothetical protein
MKLLKIFSAILLFSFITLAPNHLCAQEEEYQEAGKPSPNDPNEPAKSWSRSMGPNDVLENGNYSAKFFRNGQNTVKIVITNIRNFSVREVETAWNVSAPFVSQSIYENAGNVEFRMQTMGNNAGVNLSREDRKTNPYWKKFKVLNSDVIVNGDAYMKLESDGRFVIYSGKGGVPVVEF